MKNESNEISIFKKITNYKRITKLENDGFTHKEIAQKLGLKSYNEVEKILSWGKSYFRESELLEFNKLSPKASRLLLSNKNINQYEDSLPKNETRILNLEKLNNLGIPKERMIYLKKLSQSLESGNNIKLKLRHLVYFHNKWIELLISNSHKKFDEQIPVDKNQESWLFLLAGLDTCSKIFIDKKLSNMFEGLKDHIIESRPWYLLKNKSENNLSMFKKLFNSLFSNQLQISDIELSNGNKRVERYIVEATNYSNKIRVYLDNLTRELNQYSIIDFKKILKNIIPLPDSISKKQFVKTKYIEIDTLRFFSVEFLNLSIYNCYRLISLEIIDMEENEFKKNYIPDNSLIKSSNYSDYKDYYLWCRRQTKLEYEKLVEYEKKGKKKSSEKIIQVNALGDLLDDIGGDLDII